MLRLSKIMLFFGGLLLVGCPLLARAVESAAETIIVRQYVSGLPVTPPTTPASLSASPISTSEISLAWSTSTDTFGLAGYVIFRDNLAIATTGPVDNYLDQGLMASTTYRYFVQAFNIFALYSSSSPVATATTFALPPPVPPTPTPVISLPDAGTGGSMLLRVYNFVAEPIVDNRQRSIRVSFETNLPVLASIRYGETPDLMTGSTAGATYGLTHSFLITDLVRQGEYYLTINLRTLAGITYQLRPVVVMVGSPQFVPTPRNLSIARQGTGLFLSWNNPSPADYDEVVLLRSTAFYPVDRWSGVPVARGRLTTFFDREVKPGQDYYYALFACTRDGRCSGGAFAVARVTIDAAEIWGQPAVHWPSISERVINVSEDEVFRLAARPIGDARGVRLVALHLFRADKWYASYQLLPEEIDPSVFVARLAISQADQYHFRIEQYGFANRDPLLLDSGLIKVSPVYLSTTIWSGTTYLAWYLILVLLIILLFLIRRRRDACVKIEPKYS